MIQLIIGCAVLLENTYSAKYYNRDKNNEKNIVSHLLLNLFITILHFSLWLRVCGTHLAHPEYTPLLFCLLKVMHCALRKPSHLHYPTILVVFFN